MHNEFIYGEIGDGRAVHAPVTLQPFRGTVDDENRLRASVFADIAAAVAKEVGQPVSSPQGPVVELPRAGAIILPGQPETTGIPQPPVRLPRVPGPPMDPTIPLIPPAERRASPHRTAKEIADSVRAARTRWKEENIGR